MKRKKEIVGWVENDSVKVFANMDDARKCLCEGTCPQAPSLSMSSDVQRAVRRINRPGRKLREAKGQRILRKSVRLRRTGRVENSERNTRKRRGRRAMKGRKLIDGRKNPDARQSAASGDVDVLSGVTTEEKGVAGDNEASLSFTILSTSETLEGSPSLEKIEQEISATLNTEKRETFNTEESQSVLLNAPVLSS